MNEEILGLLGVSPEQIQQFQQQQSLAGLGAFGTALMQAGAPQAGGRTSTLAGFGQAAPAFQQGRAQEMDNILRGLLQRRQVEQMGAEQRAKQRQQTALEGLRTQMQPVTPGTALGMPGRIGPTQGRADMIGQTPAFTRDDALRAAMNPDLPAPEREMLFKYADTLQPKVPEAIRTLEILATRPDLADFDRQRKLAGAPTSKITIDMGKTFGATLDKTMENTFDVGQKARAALPAVESMKSLIDEGVRTGFGQDTMLKFNQVGQLFNPNYKARDIAGQEAFIAFSNEIIMPQVKALGVNPTDADLNFIKAGSPTLAKSVQGNKLMINALELKFNRDTFLQDFAAQWQEDNVALIESSPVAANARYRRAVIDLTKTHPLWTEASQQLRSQYNQIINQPAGGAGTAGSPFSKRPQ